MWRWRVCGGLGDGGLVKWLKKVPSRHSFVLTLKTNKQFIKGKWR